jgi:hypothetical protein
MLQFAKKFNALFMFFGIPVARLIPEGNFSPSAGLYFLDDLQALVKRGLQAGAFEESEIPAIERTAKEGGLCRDWVDLRERVSQFQFPQEARLLKGIAFEQCTCGSPHFHGSFSLQGLKMFESVESFEHGFMRLARMVKDGDIAAEQGAQFAAFLAKETRLLHTDKDMEAVIATALQRRLEEAGYQNAGRLAELIMATRVSADVQFDGSVRMSVSVPISDQEAQDLCRDLMAVKGDKRKE